MDEKFFLQSKTIIAALIALFVQLAPMLGLHFTADDGALVTKHIDAIITSLMSVLAVYGRVTASKPVYVFNSHRSHSPWPIAVLALFLVACMPTGPMSPPEVRTPAKAYYAAKSSYAVAVEEAATYSQLPFCTDTLVVGCADPVIVIKLDNAVDAATQAFDTADIVFESQTTDPVTQADALSAATVALRTLTAILATAVVAENAT